MIDKFVNQIINSPQNKTLYKAKLEIIDWIGYSIAGTFTNQAKPFYNLQKALPRGTSLNLFDKKELNIFDSAFEEEFRTQYDFYPPHSNLSEYIEDDTEYGPLNFLREHVDPNFPADLVHEAEYDHYYQVAFREHMRDDEWVRDVIKERTNDRSTITSSPNRNFDARNETTALNANCILQPKPPALVPSQVLHHGSLTKHMQIHRTTTGKLGRRARKNRNKKRYQNVSQRPQSPPSCKKEYNLFGDHPV